MLAEAKQFRQSKSKREMLERIYDSKDRDYDNDGLDPSEEYFRKKKKGNDEDTYFPPEESEPPHY